MTTAFRSDGLSYYAVAFVNGGVLMGVEILASRVLSPSFGNTIFVWGALIGLFMAGMALGYYLGGWLGDHAPVGVILPILLLLPGLWLLLFPELAFGLCDWLADRNLGPRIGPLLATSALFLVPTVCMGAVSPCIFVRLFRTHSAAGRSVGSLYAISTLGSILGTLGTSFYLILWLGTAASLRFYGALLVVIALLVLIIARRRS